MMRRMIFGLKAVLKSAFIATLLSLVLAVWPAAAEKPTYTKDDPLFDGQIRSMTDPEKELKPSGDPRFQDNEDGTVTDLEQGLMWKKNDSYQELKKWINWAQAQEYLKKKNQEEFAGHDDWRLPTRDELLSLYDPGKSVPWAYYWTENQVHIDPVFGNTSCCFWTSETHKKRYAWGVNFIRGKAYLSLKDGPGLSLSVIRLVRTMELEALKKAKKAAPARAEMK